MLLLSVLMNLEYRMWADFNGFVMSYNENGELTYKGELTKGPHVARAQGVTYIFFLE